MYIVIFFLRISFEILVFGCVCSYFAICDGIGYCTSNFCILKLQCNTWKSITETTPVIGSVDALGQDFRWLRSALNVALCFLLWLVKYHTYHYLSNVIRKRSWKPQRLLLVFCAREWQYLHIWWFTMLIFSKLFHSKYNACLHLHYGQVGLLYGWVFYY